MKEYILKIKVKASDISHVENTGAVLQNIVNTVSEKEMIDVAKKVREKPTFFAQIVKKINNPFVNSLVK